MLDGKYLPGALNIVADMESKKSFQDSGDWHLNRMIFQKIWERWHPEIDLFALPWNAQLPEFVCWHSDPAAWMTDAFSLNWKYIKGYAFPPFNLIENCIRKMRQDQAQLTLVCPYWPSQPLFLLLLEVFSAGSVFSGYFNGCMSFLDIFIGYMLDLSASFIL